MLPWEIIERVEAAEGGELVLCRRGDEFVIRHNGGAELMSSRKTTSEEGLARLGCAELSSTKGARVLVGGLGLGFTLRAALASVTKDSRVDVAEVVPAVVRWNREKLGKLYSDTLADPRVRVLEGDVGVVIANARREYDAILLDVDNGSRAMTKRSNARLYGAKGLGDAAKALRPGGVLAVWSASDDEGFVKALKRAKFDLKTERIPAAGQRGMRYVVWLARVSG